MKAIIGWMIVRRKRDAPKAIREYANGAGAFVPQRRRAFIFTTPAGNSHDASDMRGGRSWARAHRAELRKMVPSKGYRVWLIRLVKTTG